MRRWVDVRAVTLSVVRRLAAGGFGYTGSSGALSSCPNLAFLMVVAVVVVFFVLSLTLEPGRLPTSRGT
jgi:uncharacterized membrane protein YtjA (UPF0391 family)